MLYFNVDVCIVFINFYVFELFDRKNLIDKFSDDFVFNVVSWCSNIIVIVYFIGICLVEVFIIYFNVIVVVMVGLLG